MNKDDYVEAVFEGEVKNLHKMLLLCKKGPEGANITSINSKEEPVKKEKEFRIVH